MPGLLNEQDVCDGGGDGEPIGAGFLIIPTSTGKYDRLWRLGWNVRRFVAALCKRKASVQISGVPFLLQSQQPSRTFSARSLQVSNDNGVPPASSTTVPLLQPEEFGNGDSSADCHLGANSEETDSGHKQNSTENGSSASVFRRLQSQLSGALSDSGDRRAPSPATEPLLQSGEPNEEASSADQNENASTSNGSPPVISRVQSQLMRLASSSARASQLAIEAPKKIHSNTVSDAPSPSPTAPLLQWESAPAHVAVDFGSDDAEDEELQRKIARILEERNVELLRASGGAEKLARAFGSHLVYGKNEGFGESVVTHKKLVLVKDFPRFFIRACNKYTIFLLIISACFSLAFEMVEKSPKKGWHDGAAIFLAASLIVTVNSVSSFRHERKQEKNMLNERGIEMTVIRSGQRELVPIYGIVKGDILCLEKDQTVPVDGLLVDGSIVVDGRSDKNIDPHHNPFMFSGSMVVEGEGRMLATSIGSNVVSFKEALLESRISKPNSWAEFFSLYMSLLIVLVLFLRFLRRKHDYDDNGGSPQVKGEVTVQTVLKIFERMFLKPRGTISILTSSLAAVVIGIQHGMPFVISISLAYWNQKNATGGVELQNLSACGTMGLVTVICIDVSGGLIAREAASEHGIESMKEAVGAFKMAKVDIKLVSGDDGLPALTQIARDLGIFTADPIDHEAVEGQAFRNMDTDELQTRVDQIKVMANFLPKDKLSMVQCLKETGHVVAFYGGGSTARDAPVLRSVDVGISDQNNTEMARNSSDIIINSYQSFNSLVPVCNYGRWAYYNIQKFIQLQLTVMVSSLLITSVATMASGESPITLIQSIWVNLITSILGGLMLVMNPQSQELDRLQAPGSRNEPVITKAMWVYMLTQILYQASVLLVLRFKGQSILSINRRDRKAMVFNGFALCQIFNYANAMELEKKWRNGIKQKGLLAAAVGAGVGAQMLVAEIWARLNWWQWGVCFMIAAVPWGLESGMKTLSPYIPNCWSFSSISSQIRRSDLDAFTPRFLLPRLFVFVFPSLIILELFRAS